MLEFTIYVKDYRDVLKYHKGNLYIVSFEQEEFKFSNVSAVCFYKRKQKDGSSVIKFRIEKKG